MAAITFGSALVLGATGGLGAAFVRRLAASGRVAGLSRRDGLDRTDPPGAEAALDAAIADAGPFDPVVDATGVLEPDGYAPEKKLAALDAGGMAAHFAINAIGPALALKRYEALLAPDGRSVFATLSARLLQVIGGLGPEQSGGFFAYDGRAIAW